MKPKLSELILAFEAAASDDDWEEYGRSDEDDAKGLKAVLAALNLEYEDDTVYDCGRLTTAEELARREKERAEYRKKYPPSKELENLALLTADRAIRDYITDTVFSSAKAFQFIRGEHAPHDP